MCQSTATSARQTTATTSEIESQADALLALLRPRLIELLTVLHARTLTPAGFLAFERSLFRGLLEFGRIVLETTLNCLEGDGGQLPHDVLYLGEGYRRLGKKTRNAHVATLFGTITLVRFGYRFWEPLVREACIFPLELRLGLVEGVTPALADYLGQKLAEAGATQKRVLRNLKREHQVSLGVKRLRKLLAALNKNLAEHRPFAQVAALLAALKTADASRGGRKPVLAVGRDGITTRDYKHRGWEVATVATLTVFDRAGRRLTTVYLAWRPEAGQTTMSQMLTDLLQSVLRQWEGPLPTLAYVADSGGRESSYFEDTLRKMLHPRTGEPLLWERVVDYYHAAQRIWTMAGALFGAGSRRYHAWAQRMLHILKTEHRGAKRVLHSAASLAARARMSKTVKQEFETACRFLRARTKWMRYREYKKRHIPLGSGITEAACKTVYTQRLKLSGMRWSKDGAQDILGLRTTLLSGVWEATYGRSLLTFETALPRPYVKFTQNPEKIAA